MSEETAKVYRLKSGVQIHTHGPQCNPLTSKAVIREEVKKHLIDSEKATEDDFEESKGEPCLAPHKHLSRAAVEKKLIALGIDWDKKASEDDHLISLLEQATFTSN